MAAHSSILAWRSPMDRGTWQATVHGGSQRVRHDWATKHKLFHIVAQIPLLLISFRIDWFDLLAVQRTVKSLLQHHSLKASILWCSAFFVVQLSHLYMTAGKTIALTLQTFVCKVIFLPFNIPSTFVIVFLTRNKCLNFMASVIIHSDFGAQESKICHCFHFFSIYLPWSDSIRYHDLHFLNIEFLASFYTPPLHPHVFPFCFLPLEWYHLHIWGYWYFSQQSWFQLVIYPTWHFTWYTLHIS